MEVRCTAFWTTWGEKKNPKNGGKISKKKMFLSCRLTPDNRNRVCFVPTHILSCSTGLVPEFVNPKYSDDTRTAFNTPTRLECMMQVTSIVGQYWLIIAVVTHLKVLVPRLSVL